MPVSACEWCGASNAVLVSLSTSQVHGLLLIRLLILPAVGSMMLSCGTALCLPATCSSFPAHLPLFHTTPWLRAACRDVRAQLLQAEARAASAAEGLAKAHADLEAAVASQAAAQKEREAVEKAGAEAAGVATEEVANLKGQLAQVRGVWRQGRKGRVLQMLVVFDAQRTGEASCKVWSVASVCFQTGGGGKISCFSLCFLSFCLCRSPQQGKLLLSGAVGPIGMHLLSEVVGPLWHATWCHASWWDLCGMIHLSGVVGPLWHAPCCRQCRSSPTLSLAGTRSGLQWSCKCSNCVSS